MNKEKIDTIKNLLTKGETLKAIEELKGLYKPYFYRFREIRRLEARLNILQKSNMKGIIDHNQYTIEANKINDSILIFLEHRETEKESIRNWKPLIVTAITLGLIGLIFFINAKGEIYKPNPDSIKLNIFLGSKKIGHKFLVLKTMNIELFKNKIVRHYGVHDILRERNERYDELILKANNIKLENESISLEEGGVESGDQIKIIPLLRENELVKVQIHVPCDTSFSKLYIDEKLIQNISKSNNIIRRKLEIGRHEISIPEIEFSSTFKVHKNSKKITIECRY